MTGRVPVHGAEPALFTGLTGTADRETDGGVPGREGCPDEHSPVRERRSARRGRCAFCGGSTGQRRVIYCAQTVCGR